MGPCRAERNTCGYFFRESYSDMGARLTHESVAGVAVGIAEGGRIFHLMVVCFEVEEKTGYEGNGEPDC